MALGAAFAASVAHAQLFIDTTSSTFAKNTSPSGNGYNGDALSATFKLTSASNVVAFNGAVPDITDFDSQSAGSSLYLGNFDTNILKSATSLTSVTDTFNLKIAFSSGLDENNLSLFTISKSMTITYSMTNQSGATPRQLVTTFSAPSGGTFTYNNTVFTYSFALYAQFDVTNNPASPNIDEVNTNLLGTTLTSRYSVPTPAGVQTLNIPDFYLFMNVNPPVPEFSPVPEPSTYALAGVVLLGGMVALRRYRGNKVATLA